jgi:hypothetical protein
MQLTWQSSIVLLCIRMSLPLLADDKPATRKNQDDKLVAKPDSFKTLVNPKCSHCVDEAKRRVGELRDDDRVLAWIRGYSQGGGIPLRFFLVPYRVISDTYGVFVYDHEANYMRGFEPSLDFEFYGWRNGVMVMRHKDGTLYSCLSGRAFDGPRKGHQLKPVPTLETDWGWWLDAYPGAVAYHMFEKYQPIELPKAENKESVSTRVAADKRLLAMEPVIGLAIGNQSRAFPIAELEKAGGLINGWNVGREKVVVLWYPATRTAATYAPELDAEKDKPNQSVSLKVDRSVPDAPFVDTETGSHFDIVGRAVDGPLKGRTLRWLPGVQCRWFAWSAEYPDTKIAQFPADPTTGPAK